jgi:hypothetical protein
VKKNKGRKKEEGFLVLWLGYNERLVEKKDTRRKKEEGSPFRWVFFLFDLFLLKRAF